MKLKNYEITYIYDVNHKHLLINLEYILRLFYKIIKQGKFEIFKALTGLFTILFLSCVLFFFCVFLLVSSLQDFDFY